MERVYRVMAIRRDGVWQYWEPTLGQFTFKDMPTNRYHDFPEADDEYRKAIDEADIDVISSVAILEHRKKDDTWYTLTYREFTRKECSIKSAMDNMSVAKTNMKIVSGKLREIAELYNLTRETREELERISDKLHSLAELTQNLQEKILEELE